jgi:hypothetical protein
VLFLDGDTVLARAFVARALEELSRADVAIVWGHRREICPERSVYNRVLDLDWVYPPGASSFCGGDALMRRSVLDAVGGYDEDLIAGEEPEMCQRILAAGHVILHIDAPMTGHDLAMTRWSQYWQRALRAGYAYAQVARRFRHTPQRFWEREVRSNLRHIAVLGGVVAAGVAVSAWLGNASGLLLAVGLLLVLVLRTAYRARWRSPDPVTLFLYGVHSHLQQAPIALGQLLYHRDRLSGRLRTLIEYKEAQG